MQAGKPRGIVTVNFFVDLSFKVTGNLHDLMLATSFVITFISFLFHDMQNGIGC